MTVSRAWVLAIAMAVCAGAACADRRVGDGSDPDGGARDGAADGIGATVTLHHPCPDDSPPVGMFALDTWDNGFGMVLGHVSGVVHDRAGFIERTFFERTERVSTLGACRLERWRFCESSCPSGFTCGVQNRCEPSPVAVDVGTVTLAVGVLARSLIPTFDGYGGEPFEIDPPPYVAGDRLLLQATGGAGVPPFEVLGTGIDSIEITAHDPIAYRDHPYAFSWAARPGSGAQISVMFTLQPSTLQWLVECDFADSGAAEIPAAYVNELFDHGLAGWPKLVVSRSTAASTAIPLGCVELWARSGQTVRLEVDGVSRCDAVGGCPPPLVCQDGYTCG